MAPPLQWNEETMHIKVGSGQCHQELAGNTPQHNPILCMNMLVCFIVHWSSVQNVFNP